MPEFGYGLSAYYLIAPAEASSNLARYDGVRYGLRVDGEDAAAMNTATRTAGFGAEVKRRIMLGTYALSAGYYDAYYAQAQRVRTLVMQAFDRAYESFDVLLGATAPTTAFDLGAKVDDPMAMYMNDVCTIPSNLSGHPAVSVPFGTGADGLPVGVQVLAPALQEALLFRVARVVEAHAPKGAGVMSTDWELVVGLEVHCELATATKLFCGCRNAFGDEPNVNICPTCLGLPGSLPVLNEQAVELAMRIGAALHCEIRPSVFARKNYFYPDQAKDYQISQYDLPLNAGGWLELPDGFRVGVTRAHMEEDTGKLTHVGASGRINAALHALVDYNRSGVPLVEIVSEPDIRTAAQARAYASELRGILDGDRCLRRADGGGVDAGGRQRLGPPRRHRRLRHPLRDQEPELAALARSGYRVRGGAPDRPSRVRRHRRARRPGTGTSRPGAPIRCAPRRRRTTTATSPSRTWCPWRPTRRGRSGCGPAWARCRRTAGPCWHRHSAGRRRSAETDQIHAVVDLGLDAAGDGRRRCGRAVRPGPGPCRQRGRRPGRGGTASLDPKSFASLLGHGIEVASSRRPSPRPS